jgi:hypothetical protein
LNPDCLTQSPGFACGEIKPTYLYRKAMMGFFSRLFGSSRSPTAEDNTIPRIRGNGKFTVEVVGESHYRDAFRRLFANQRAEDQENEVDIDAELVLQNDNPHDSLAVAVKLSGMDVGYLPREMARDFRAAIKRDGINRWTTYRIAAKVYMGGKDELWSVRIDLPEA